MSLSDEDKTRLQVAAASLTWDKLDKLRKECEKEKSDFHKKVAGFLLEKPMDQVTTEERSCVKAGLFLYMYGSRR